MRRNLVWSATCLIAVAGFVSLSSQMDQAKAGPNPIWGTATPISTSAVAFAGNPHIDQDGFGNLHLAFVYCANGWCPLFYTKRDTQGVWGPLESPPGQTPMSWRYSDSLLVSSDGTVHVFWADQHGGVNTGFHYVQRSPTGNWGEPEEHPYIGSTLLSCERDGYVYVIGDTFAVRAPDGTWTTEPVPGYVYAFAISPGGQQYLLYGSSDNLILATRQEGEAWSAGENVTSIPARLDTAKLVLDDSGNPRVIWREYATYQCFPLTCDGFSLHYREANGGTWSAQEDLALLKGSNYGFITSDVAVADDGTRYVSWSSDEEAKGQPTVFISRRNGANDWTTPTTHAGFGVKLLSDKGTIHAFWQYQGYTLFHWVAYSREGYWSNLGSLVYSYDVGLTYDVDPDIDASGRLHLVWPDRSDTFRLMYRSWDAANVPTLVPTATATLPAPTTTPIPQNQRVFLPGLSK